MKLHGTMRINEKNHLEIGGCDTVDLAEKYGTPLWVMDEEYIRKKCREYKEAFIEKNGGDAAYAGKAFLTLAMAAIIKEEGLSLDVVSGGELYTALKADFPPERIYFHGNNKSLKELEMAVEVGVGRIVIDNYHEIEMLEQVLHNSSRKEISAFIRVTPGIEAHTHDYIRTGQEDSKFGFSLANGDAHEAVRRILNSDSINLKGVHCHIGSQIFETDPFAMAADVMLKFISDVKKELDIELNELNLGGGFGIYYSSGDRPLEVNEYAEAIVNKIKEKAGEYDIEIPKIIVEPGRSIAGPAGTTLYTVGAVKEIPGVRKYVSVDGGMADNIRPALYKAEYEALLANKVDVDKREVVSIAGKCCESGDMLIWDASIPEVEPGDILAVLSTGGYGYSMASNYNKLGKPPVVLVKDGKSEMIVKKETEEDLIRNELLPERLS